MLEGFLEEGPAAGSLGSGRATSPECLLCPGVVTTSSEQNPLRLPWAPRPHASAFLVLSCISRERKWFALNDKEGEAQKSLGKGRALTPHWGR